ncbi:MAG: PTS sugar transporter subunit IIA [Erysipelotrichaceae bacterium]
MIGIVLISHGDMANGMVNSAGMFFGETGLQQVATVSLLPHNSPEEFDVMLTDAINKVDTGDGVVILADLLGGTPCNRAAYKASENVQVITGMNLPIFVELLGLRMGGDVDFNNLISAGHDGIVSLNKLLGGN